MGWPAAGLVRAIPSQAKLRRLSLLSHLRNCPLVAPVAVSRKMGWPAVMASPAVPVCTVMPVPFRTVVGVTVKSAIVFPRPSSLAPRPSPLVSGPRFSIDHSHLNPTDKVLILRHLGEEFVNGRQRHRQGVGGQRVGAFAVRQMDGVECQVNPVP